MKLIRLGIYMMIGLSVGCGAIDTIPSEDVSNNDFTLNETIPLPFVVPQAIIIHKTSEYFFVALKGQGVSIYKKGVPKSQKVSNIPRTKLGGLHAMHLDLNGDYLYISLGDLFASSSKTGLAIVNVSNPKQPVVSALWVSPTKTKGSAIVKVQGNFAYLGAMNEGIYVFNISNKSKVVLVSKFIPNINFPTPNPNSVQHPNARGIDIKGDKLYLCYDAGGIRILDITNKKQLKEIGRFVNTSPNMKQRAYNNVIISGNYAYAAVDYCGLEIIDISNPKKMNLVGWWNPWNCNSASNNWFNSKGHTNQLSYNVSNKKIYLSSGRSELNIIDVSNPSTPKEIKNYGDSNNKKATWGMTRDNNTIYLLYITSIVPFQANWAGIKIITEK